MKILGSDFDGTLTVGGIDEAKCEAIRAWRRAGNLFGLVSGRSPGFLGSLRKQYPALEMDFLVAYNGAFTVDAEGKILDTVECYGVPARELAEALMGWGCPFVYVNSADSVGAERSYTVRRGGAPLKANECYLSDLPCDLPFFRQISVQLETPTEAVSVTRRLRDAYGGRVNPLRNHSCIDIVDASVNKAEGLRRLAAVWGEIEAEIITVGDNINDLDMLRAFPSYAMENGVEEVKRVAGRTVKSVTELILRELHS